METPGVGSWPQWWKPVSSLYGSDLAIQHLFANLTEELNHPQLTFDTHSSRRASFMQAKHIHAFHSLHKFNKFAFYNNLKTFCNPESNDTKEVSEEYQNFKDFHQVGKFPSNMSIPDYLGNVSMIGAIEYFNRVGCTAV